MKVLTRTKVRKDRCDRADTALNRPQWENFCKHFTSRECLGHGAESYAKAYPRIDRAKNCLSDSTMACGLLKKPIILARIRWLLENSLGLNDLSVDRELAFLIQQSADLRTKLGAINAYNDLRGRIKRKLELSFKDSSDAELDEELKLLEREIIQGESILAQHKERAPRPAGLPLLTDAQEAASASGKLVIPIIESHTIN